MVTGLGNSSYWRRHHGIAMMSVHLPNPSSICPTIAAVQKRDEAADSVILYETKIARRLRGHGKLVTVFITSDRLYRGP